MVVPVLVGVGRVTERRTASLQEASSPLQLAKVAAEGALRDAAVDAAALDAVMFVDMVGELRLPRKIGRLYDNPAETLARSLGRASGSVSCFQTYEGGNQAQHAVNEAAERIAKGEFGCCLVSGAEALDTLMTALKRGYRPTRDEPTSEERKVLHWGDKTGTEPKPVGTKTTLMRVHDLVHGLTDMPTCYAMAEQDLQRADGVDSAARCRGNARILSGLSKVAARPENLAHSWFPIAREVDEIATVSETNRMVAEPYSKLNCAIMDVNQAAGVLVMSDERAKALGVPEHKWVYLHGCADCNDIGVPVMARPSFRSSAGMRIVGKHAFDSANVSPHDVEFFDIYSCFPVAVRLACREMNLPLDPERDAERLSVTGGLPFHGGPGNNYALHSIAAMVETLRAHPGAFGLVTANGGVLAKHSAGVYSTTPYAVTHPEHPREWRRPSTAADLEAARAHTPPRTWPTNPGKCQGVLLHHTVNHSKAGPQAVTAIGDITSGMFAGQRFVAKSTKPEVVAFFHGQEAGPASVRVELETSDWSGKGKHFEATFSLLSAGKL